MNQSHFLKIIKTAQPINTLQTSELSVIIDAFPYFQSARALYLKGLKNTNNFKYNNTLKTTAAYTTDRSILFDFITSETFIQNEISQFITQNTKHLKNIEVQVEDISINKKRTIRDILTQQIEEAKKTFDPKLFEPKIKKEVSLEEKTTTPETILNIGKPLEFNKNETHSFNEWLSLAQFKPINRAVKCTNNSSEEKKEKKPEATSSLARTKKFELIEKFIEKSPKLVAKKTPISTKNIAKDQMIQPEALMTETLARIYLEQHNYKKAIQSYKILSLKYPEKSGFFADQIKAVKELQEQNNKE